VKNQTVLPSDMMNIADIGLEKKVRFVRVIGKMARRLIRSLCHLDLCAIDHKVAVRVVELGNQLLEIRAVLVDRLPAAVGRGQMDGW
jgi:hypothetical protein